MSEKITCMCGETYFDPACFVYHYQKCSNVARAQQGGEAVAWIVKRPLPWKSMVYMSKANAQAFSNSRADASCPMPLVYPQPAPSVPEGYTPVRTLVLKWLLGETEAFEPVEGERGKFWWRKRLREAILDTTTPQPADNWKPLTKARPQHWDADVNAQVWLSDGKSLPVLRQWDRVPEFGYWMPTGLKRPNPPEQESG